MSNQKAAKPISHAYIKACANSQVRIRDDFNTGDNEGAVFGNQQYSIQTTKMANDAPSRLILLPYVKNRENLEIITKANVVRIIFDGKKAVGLEYMHQGKKRKSGHIKR